MPPSAGAGTQSDVLKKAYRKKGKGKERNQRLHIGAEKKHQHRPMEKQTQVPGKEDQG